LKPSGNPEQNHALVMTALAELVPHHSFVVKLQKNE
jgi:hypothetical protein